MCMTVSTIMFYQNYVGRNSHDIVANVLDCNIVVSKFKLQSHPYIYFGSDIIGKDINPFLSLAMG